VFGDKQRYPRFYRLVPEAREFSDGYIAIVEHLHWRRVAVVYYSDDFTLDVSVYVVIVYGIVWEHIFTNKFDISLDYTRYKL